VGRFEGAADPGIIDKDIDASVFFAHPMADPAHVRFGAGRPYGDSMPSRRCLLSLSRFDTGFVLDIDDRDMRPFLRQQYAGRLAQTPWRLPSRWPPYLVLFHALPPFLMRYFPRIALQSPSLAAHTIRA